MKELDKVVDDKGDIFNFDPGTFDTRIKILPWNLNVYKSKYHLT